jgi:pyroglutamyl-peptidase
MDSSKGDNDGYIPDEETICSGAPAAYFTKMPVKALRDYLIKVGIPTKVSSSAGLYVCNATYFAALHHIATVGRYSETVFIHLPKISDEWPIERMKVAINKMINNYGKEDCNS